MSRSQWDAALVMEAALLRAAAVAQNARVEAMRREVLTDNAAARTAAAVRREADTQGGGATSTRRRPAVDSYRPGATDHGGAKRSHPERRRCGFESGRRSGTSKTSHVSLGLKGRAEPKPRSPGQRSSTVFVTDGRCPRLRPWR